MLTFYCSVNSTAQHALHLFCFCFFLWIGTQVYNYVKFNGAMMVVKGVRMAQS